MDHKVELLRQAFDSAVTAASPGFWLADPIQSLSLPIRNPSGGVQVIALGKGSIAMVEAIPHLVTFGWKGLVVTPLGTAKAVDQCEVLEAGHPVPDAASLAAGAAALARAADATPDDILLLLISGGASALACAPIPGVSLAAKADLSKRLLGSGASIGELNTVRRALSRLKGGGLARATRASRVVTLAMSDVPGDVLADIGSGPGVPSPTGVEEALAVLNRFASVLVDELRAPMQAWAASQASITTPTEGRVVFPIDGGVRAASSALAQRGWVVNQTGVVTGGVDTAVQAVLPRLAGGRRALVSGGELSLAVAEGAKGRGGRNQHYLLSLAVELAGRTDVWALAADTDGIDGSSDAAGAWIDPGLLGTLDRAEAEASLAAFDAHGFFERHDRLIRTGPTGVNVGDLRILLVDPTAHP